MDFRLETIRELLAVQRMRRAAFDPEKANLYTKVFIIVLSLLFTGFGTGLLLYKLWPVIFFSGTWSVM